MEDAILSQIRCFSVSDVSHTQKHDSLLGLKLKQAYIFHYLKLEDNIIIKC